MVDDAPDPLTVTIPVLSGPAGYAATVTVKDPFPDPEIGLAEIHAALSVTAQAILAVTVTTKLSPFPKTVLNVGLTKIDPPVAPL